MKCINKRNYSFNSNAQKAKLLPVLISTSMAISMSGCSPKKNTVKYLNKNGIELTQLYDQSEEYDLYLVDGINIDNVSDDELKDDINDSLADYTFVSPNEYLNYSSKKDANVNDILNLINNNKDLKDADKKVLTDGLKKLNESEIDLNYHILYDNLKDLSIEYFDVKPENMQGSAYGWFSALQKKIYIPTEKYLKSFNSNDLEHIKNFVLCHELFGHGSMSYVDKERKLCCSFENNVYYVSKEGSYINEVGHFVEEGCADIVALNCVGKAEAGYPLCDYFVKTLESTLNISFNDVYHNDSSFIDNKFKEMNIKNGYDLLFSFDSLISYFSFANHEIILDESAVTEIFTNIYKGLINKLYGEGLSNDEILSNIKRAIYSYSDLMTIDTQDGIIIAMADNVNGVIYVNPDHLYQICEQYLNTLSLSNNQRKRA